MDAETLASELAQIPPGTDPFDWLSSRLTALVHAPPSRSFLVKVYVLVALHSLVLILSLIGLVARWRNGQAWLFASNNGLLRPNTAVTTYLLFATYCFLQLISYPLSPLRKDARPPLAAFTFSLLSYTPLGLSFHLNTWATALVPSTTLAHSPRPIHHLSRSPHSEIRFNRLKSGFAIGTAIAYVLTLIGPTWWAATAWKRFQIAEAAVIDGIAAAKAKGVGVIALLDVVPLGQEMVEKGEKTQQSFRALIAYYFAWALLWLAVYIPTSLRLLYHLSRRRSRLSRTIKSLRVLDELCSSDSHHQHQLSSSPSSPLAPSPPAPVKGRREKRSSDTSDTSRPLVAIRSEIPRNGNLAPPSPSGGWRLSRESVRATATRTLIEMGIASSPPFVVVHEHHPTTARASTVPKQIVNTATAARIEEARVDLQKTNRFLVTVALQLGITILMCSSYFAFCVYVLAGGAETTLQKTYVTWTGWTFAFPALVGASVFSTLSILAPRTERPEGEDDEAEEPNTTTSKTRKLVKQNPNDHLASPSRSLIGRFFKSRLRSEIPIRMELNNRDEKMGIAGRGGERGGGKDGLSTQGDLDLGWVPSLWVQEREWDAR